MTKPQRRRSQLSGLSAVAPQPPAAAPEPAAETTPASQPPRQTPRPMPTSGTGEAKKKLAYYVDDDTNGRIRAAFLAGRDRYGWRSFTDFQLATMLERVEQLENELNGGTPFDGIPPKGGPLGRPLD